MNDLPALLLIAASLLCIAVIGRLAFNDARRQPHTPHEIETIVLMEVLGAAIEHADLDPKIAAAIMASWTEAVDGTTVRCSCGRTVLLADDDEAWTDTTRHTAQLCEAE